MKKFNISTKQVAVYERQYEVELPDAAVEYIRIKAVDEDWDLEDVFNYLQNEGFVDINDCEEDYNEESEEVYDGRYVLSQNNQEIDNWLDNIREQKYAEEELVDNQ
jgi:hypothetical protein